MEFGQFKELLGLFFFGVAFVFGFLQLAAVRKLRLSPRNSTEKKEKPPTERVID